MHVVGGVKNKFLKLLKLPEFHFLHHPKLMHTFHKFGTVQFV